MLKCSLQARAAYINFEYFARLIIKGGLKSNKYDIQKKGHNVKMQIEGACFLDIQKISYNYYF